MTPRLDAATEMLDTILPCPGARIAVGSAKWTSSHSVRWYTQEWGLSWRTVNEAKRRAGNIRSIKQGFGADRFSAGWIWVRE